MSKDSKNTNPEENSPKDIAGIFAAVVKNSTFGSWCIINLN